MSRQTVPLLAADAVRITTVSDNSIDLLLADTEVACRLPLGPNPFERPLPIAERGFSVLIGVSRGDRRVLFAGPLLMILFRQKYPRWWFDWNLELQRFGSRVVAYLALMDDRYPSTDHQQSVHLDYTYPDAKQELNRWLPLAKWFLAIPHLVVLVFLNFAAVVAVIGAWCAIVVTGRYPRGLFAFVEGVIRWNDRVIGYALTLVTDEYPPFRLYP